MAEDGLCGPTGASPPPEQPARGPERTCVGCRVRAPAARLLRVVVQGTVLVPDPRRRLPGRGASVHFDQACVALAVRRRAFHRALRVSGQLDVSAVLALVGDGATLTTVTDRDEDRSRTHEHAVKQH